MLRDGDKANFDTLLKAARNGELGLLEVKHKQTGEQQAMVCALNYEEDGSVEFVPLALMLDADELHKYEPPA